jgi:hypothetical protein
MLHGSSLLRGIAVILALVSLQCLRAQNISPIIAEYNDKAAGSFEVSNSGLVPAVVVLEPKSFSIQEDGEGVFRDLDPSIHLELSTTSLRLEPRQTARVFYKVTADKAPAWLCIYATFSAAKKQPGINLRLMLPHTIYVYQHASLSAEAISVGRVYYDRELRRVFCEITNNSDNAGRAQSVDVTGSHASASAGGFPLLPHLKRVVSVDWHEENLPTKIDIEFEHFSIKRTVDPGTLRGSEG